MPALLSFIGWHNSGKTTLATRVVAELIVRGWKVAVVKSTKEDASALDTPQSDSASYRQAGAAVLLAGDGFLFLQQPQQKPSLALLAARFFADMDLVIGEGFKREEGLAKIEVFAGEEPELAAEVDGVIAVVGDGDGVGGKDGSVAGWRSFTCDAYKDIADFIEQHFLKI